MREYSKSTRRRGSGVWAWPDAVKRLGGGRAMDGAEERDAVTGGRVQVASSRYLSWGGTGRRAVCVRQLQHVLAGESFTLSCRLLIVRGISHPVGGFKGAKGPCPPELPPSQQVPGEATWRL